MVRWYLHFLEQYLADSTLLGDTRNSELQVSQRQFGFNIFVYLGKGTQSVTDLIQPIVSKLTMFFTNLTTTIVNETSANSKVIIDKTTQVVDNSLTSLQDATKTKLRPDVIQPPDKVETSTFNRALNTTGQETAHDNEYNADESDSHIQSKGSKSGWCFIGEDRNFRSCAEVGENDKCMSGDIFPSHEICVNPSLRA
jgi:hypothetical protein